MQVQIDNKPIEVNEVILSYPQNQDYPAINLHVSTVEENIDYYTNIIKENTVEEISFTDANDKQHTYIIADPNRTSCNITFYDTDTIIGYSFVVTEKII